MRDYIIGALLGWFGKKLRAAASVLWRCSWAWMRATSWQRWAFVTVLYTKFVERIVQGIKDGSISDPTVKRWVKRLDARVYPRLKSWGNRVRSPAAHG